MIDTDPNSPLGVAARAKNLTRVVGGGQWNWGNFQNRYNNTFDGNFDGTPYYNTLGQLVHEALAPSRYEYGGGSAKWNCIDGQPSYIESCSYLRPECNSFGGG
jgi:hypothetical protein